MVVLDLLSHALQVWETIMAAGAVAVPTIIPLRAPYPGQHKAAVDTSTKIELHSGMLS